MGGSHTHVEEAIVVLHVQRSPEWSIALRIMVVVVEEEAIDLPSPGLPFELPVAQGFAVLLCFP
jgi:hypothetical protein